MAKLKLDVSIKLLFDACIDIEKITKKNKGYYYFKPVKKADLVTVRYVLRQINVQSDFHKSKYCDAWVVRATSANFAKATDDFRTVFEEKRKAPINSANKEHISPWFFLLPIGKNRKLNK